jgi:hypothetical protein
VNISFSRGANSVSSIHRAVERHCNPYAAQVTIYHIGRAMIFNVEILVNRHFNNPRHLNTGYGLNYIECLRNKLKLKNINAKYKIIMPCFNGQRVTLSLIRDRLEL